MTLREDIESRVNILDIVSRYVDTKKAGVNYKALCPFHSEKSPSFVISPQKNIAHCFSCGKWGGPINFLMEIEKIEFKEAVSILAKEAGIELKTDFQKERQAKWGDIYALYREASRWYHEALYKSENKKYLDYLLVREITDETIKKFQLGCSTSPRDLYFFLKEKWFTHDFLIESGLFLSESRDKFFSRITFPIANGMGHVVAFTGRVLDDSLPKYLNSPASAIFDKSSILYGLHLAKQAISKSGKAYIVEWQMDTIALHQAGIDSAVGISGTALTTEHVRILSRFAKILYLCLDADNAGVKATFASIENLINSDLEIRIISIPNGKDPDEYVKSWWDFATLEKSALSPIGFYMKEGGREYDISTIIGKKKLIEKCLEFLVPLKSQIEIDMHISEMSRMLGVSKEAIMTEYKKAAQYHRTRTPRPKMSEETETVKKEDFTSPELLAGYISRYDLLDLFFREFRYTLEDFPKEGGFSLLFSVVSWQKLDTEDEEKLKIIDLSLESWHLDDATAATQACIQLIKKLHETLILSLYQKELASGKPLLEVRNAFIPKARALWLNQNIFQ